MRSGGRICLRLPDRVLVSGGLSSLSKAILLTKAASQRSSAFPLTSNLRWATAPGNVPLSSGLSGLPKDSVANVSQIVALDRDLLTERVGKLPRNKVVLILAGIDTVLGK